MDQSLRLPSGKLTVCYGKSPFLMGSKSIISMAIFNSKLCVYQGVIHACGGQAMTPGLLLGMM